MKIEQFIASFASQLEDTDPSIITASTKFRELEEWNSLTALSIMAMVDDEYGIQLKGDDMRVSHTVEDLFNVLCSKK